MMNHSILLCDLNWTIEHIPANTSDLPFSIGDHLTDFLADSSQLPSREDAVRQTALLLTLHFPGKDHATSAILSAFPDRYLIFLCHTDNPADLYLAFQDYLKALAWTNESLTAPDNDFYYQIQQMNNQLINSKRALTKSNLELQRLLGEIRDANDTIALLERDELTNLLSVSAFYQKAGQMLDQNPDIDYDVLILDLKRFKLVNEIFGKEAGDKLLQDIALFLTDTPYTEEGGFSRVDADTFYIMIPSRYTYHQLLADNLPAYLENYPLPIQLHAAIGVYSTSLERLTIEAMCGRTLFALGSIADTLETNIAFYDQAMYEKLNLEHLILNHLQETLDHQEFQLYLQAKSEISTGKIVGSEALIRWHHPKLGWIRPDRFIPLLEKHGLIYKVDQYIWEKACQILAAEKAALGYCLPVSVNAARSDLYQDDLIPVLTSLIKRYNLKPQDLHIEVIERAYTEDSDVICQVLSKLRSAGFYIEMDDFGTGVSSLSMIAGMPIDYLKLDRSFLTSDLDDRRHIEIIRFIINLAKTLDLKIIAEGVETQEQAELLYSLGCYYAQGYYFDKPKPAEEFLVQLTAPDHTEHIQQPDTITKQSL